MSNPENSSDSAKVSSAAQSGGEAIASKAHFHKLPVGGGLKAVQYVMSIAGDVGVRKLAAAIKSKNTCKACAFGTGGQRGGLHNEHNTGIEICNKNIQAQSSDLRAAIPRAIFEDNSLAELRQLNGRELEALGRLGHPLHKAPGSDRYSVITYDKAFDIIAERLRATDPERSFFYSSGRSSNEAAFILQLFARLYGSNHINNCSYYCHQASGVGLQASIGTGTATIQYKDLEHADTIFVIGANPASNHPRFVKVLIECRRRGGQVIVINPAKEPGLLRFASPSNFRSMIAGGAQIASLYIQPHVGGDLALLQGIAKAVLEGGGADASFVTRYCNGFEDYTEHLGTLDWQDLSAQAGVSRQQMEQVAQLYSGSRNAVFSWGMGITHHTHGVENVEAISNLALLRGMIGAPGRGLLPLRGHSNVQGVGSMGVSPALKNYVFDNIERELGVTLPTTKGMDTLACMQAAAAGKVDLAFLLGGNLYAANPDSAFADAALAAIPFKVLINSTLNLSHVNGIGEESIVLPIRVRDEETQRTTQESMFNFVRLSDGGFERIEGLRSEVDIISDIAARVVAPEILDFKTFSEHRHIRKTIARIIPGFRQLDEIDESKQEFHIEGRVLTEPVFPTTDGRARFRVPRHDHNSTAMKAAPSCYTLTSVRSEGQFNTIIYTDNDVYRGQTERDIVLMHPEDMREEGLMTDMLVTLTNSTGTMNNLKVKPFDIRRGNLMTYFPEANVLIPQTSDPRSHTPAFKSTRIALLIQSN
ncbi:MAG: FdhF/YdeP family oxidoreductase [Gammaproteobacteria bacterium]|nr:FdhF/YdeP family oxidoreductase [Gammaproteobacteria bacterium]MDP2140789.1 FdhF/YdeP family oxidoreductase [Gammaproteobacteria bacterium]MDP2347043.1 FdhF/YdeP family oxidoreductase [Gammaproteobacteria bacterium]